MKKIIIFIIVAACSLCANAQNYHEHVNVFVDKDCYVTGEQMLLHVTVTNDSREASDLSKVAYVELCDTHQMQAQCMVELTDGEGWAALDIPGSMHSGYYQMNAYTRYMRNFGKEAYFKSFVPVVNILHPSDSDDIDLEEAEFSIPQSNSQLLTDKSEYGTRDKVSLTLPKGEAQSYTISVSRIDCEPISSFNLNYGTSAYSQYNKLFSPEIEGHIVTAKATTNDKIETSRLALIGKSGVVYDGKINNGSVNFYTQNLYGDLPVSINAYTFSNQPIQMEFTSPYEKVLADTLPELVIKYNAAQLQDRSVGTQIEKLKRDVTHISSVEHEVNFMRTEPDFMYDLDEYTKFKTVREILVEFVSGIRKRSSGGRSQLYTFDELSHEFSQWPALVLLDGMPVYDIDALMEYDARRLKYVQVYFGKYFFGSSVCQGVISFISHKGSLQDFQADKGTQIYTYSFPQDHPAFISPIYDSATRQPDTRHTLYWNPNATTDCSFYTSDLKGVYRVKAQYIDKNGDRKAIESYFTVK